MITGLVAEVEKRLSELGLAKRTRKRNENFSPLFPLFPSRCTVRCIPSKTHRVERELAGRLPFELFDYLRTTGVTWLRVPESLGGPGGSPPPARGAARARGPHSRGRRRPSSAAWSGA